MPFLFHRMFLFPSLFLLPFVIGASLFLAIPPFPLFTVPLLAFVRSFVTLPSPGNARSLFLSVSPTCLFARSLLRFLSLVPSLFHLLMRLIDPDPVLFSSLSRFAGLPPTHPPLDWGLSGKKGSPTYKSYDIHFHFVLSVRNFKKSEFQKLAQFHVAPYGLEISRGGSGSPFNNVARRSFPRYVSILIDLIFLLITARNYGVCVGYGVRVYRVHIC